MNLIILFFFSLSSDIFSQRISGVVLDNKTGEPVPEALVFLLENEEYRTTSPDGTFSFHNLDKKDYRIKVTHISYLESIADLSFDNDSSKNIVIYLFSKSIELSAVVVTDNLSRTKFDEILEENSILKGKELERNFGFTLASTLKNETGLSMRSMGPAPARPVFRGLGSDRITISEDDFLTMDLSATSPDHSVSIESFTADRIEVIRGPIILLHNSTSIGGIVNVVREEIPLSIPDRLHGNGGLYGESVNKGFLGSLVLQVPYNNFTFRLEGTKRKANDLSTPAGILKNTALQTDNYSFGLSTINKWGTLGFSFRNFESEYGIPGEFIGAHPNGVNIEMLKRNLNAKLKLNINSQNFPALSVDFSRTYYKHLELEATDLIGAEFYQLSYLGNFNFSTKKLAFFDEGFIGASFKFRDFKIGGYVFTPFTKALEISAYFYQNFVINKFNFEISVRYSFADLRPSKATASARSEFLIDRRFNLFSLSFSALYPFTENFYSGINFSRSARIPTIEELYSEGPHLAAYSYETGNPWLPLEKGYGAEIFFYYKTEEFILTTNFFRNDFSTFILPRNTGEINFATLLPIYSTEGVPAIFYGVESQFEIKFLDSFRFSSSISYTKGEIKNSGNPLPMIPPLKNFSELKFNKDNFLAGIGIETAAAQKRVDEFEEITKGYSVVNFSTQYSLVTGETVHNFSLNIDNIFNKEYRNHLSRVKIILPEAGRNFRIIYKIYF